MLQTGLGCRQGVIHEIPVVERGLLVGFETPGRFIVVDDIKEYLTLGIQERMRFLKSLFDDPVPNLPWIAKEHEKMLQALWEGNDEIDGPDGFAVSPRLHLTIHATAERQYAQGDPPVVRAVVNNLLFRHWNRHDVMHLVCLANIDELLLALKDEESFNIERLGRRLLKLASQSTRRLTLFGLHSQLKTPSNPLRHLTQKPHKH